MSEGSPFSIKRFLVGQPIPSHLAHHERLSRVTGLAVLSSDALSSVAYATDFILATLVVAGLGAFVYAIPISLVIATLLAIVAFSYRQTIHAYPTGGGAYIVAKENIGDDAGLIAAASLLVDYTLTVAVSISAGVLAITLAPRRSPGEWWRSARPWPAGSGSCSCACRHAARGGSRAAPAAGPRAPG